MLLRFRVANVRSLRDEQELSFAAPEDSETERAVARETLLSDGRRLPVHTVLGVFGANASGKSNVVASLRKGRGLELAAGALRPGRSPVRPGGAARLLSGELARAAW